jgi:hypothetical protein
LVAKSIFKFVDSQRNILGGKIISYIGVEVEYVSWRFAHEVKAGEVILLMLDLLILLWARWIITGEVEVAQGSTHSGHDLLELFLHVLEAVLLLVVALVAGVIPVGVVLLVGGVGDKMGGVTALKAAPKWSPPLLAELTRQQGDLVIRDALVLLIRSYSQRRQYKL